MESMTVFIFTLAIDRFLASKGWNIYLLLGKFLISFKYYKGLEFLGREMLSI